jgi:GTP-binding protein
VLRIAVVGRPNAGKSSFINKLLGEERHLVSDMPGTTVDSIDSFLEHAGRRWRLIDTAGIRRKRSIGGSVEKHAVVSALKGMDRADVVLLMLDATEGMADQDLKIASFADEKGKAVVVVVNKWDLAKDQKEPLDAEVYAKQIRETMPFLAHAPIRFVSAKTGKRVFDVLDTAYALAEEHFRRISTGEVNRALKAAVDAHQPPMHKNRRTRLYYGTQVRAAPPTFVIAVNDPDGVHFSYRRYLVNRFREDFGFGGAPIRLLFRKRKRERGD